MQSFDTNQIKFIGGGGASGKWTYLYFDDFAIWDCDTTPLDTAAPPPPVDTTPMVSNYFIPNTFTPNGDGTNDTWGPIDIPAGCSWEVHIFNRWGQHIQSLNPAATRWDGTYQGKKLPVGVYYYTFSSACLPEQKGSITLVR